MKDYEYEDRTSHWLARFHQLVIKHMSEERLTNAWLATQLNVSNAKLYRVVQKLTKQSPNQYIRKIRMQKAMEMLTSGHYLKVKEVARKVGFRKTEYFSKLFKAEFGIRPSEVLKKQSLNELLRFKNY